MYCTVVSNNTRVWCSKMWMNVNVRLALRKQSASTQLGHTHASVKVDTQGPGVIALVGCTAVCQLFLSIVNKEVTAS